MYIVNCNDKIKKHIFSRFLYLFVDFLNKAGSVHFERNKIIVRDKTNFHCKMDT